MRRSLLCVLSLLALVIAPAALADGGPSPGVMTGWDGITADSSAVRYVTFATANQTVVAAVQKDGGRIVKFGQVIGNWGIPVVSWDGSTSGLTRDRTTLVLGEMPTSPMLRKQSTFLVLSTKRLSISDRITLDGDFSFDALSPDGSVLYLIQHVDAQSLTRYVVRSYDLRHDRLNPGAIADKTQQGWVMAGWPMTRATSADGRWVYTLYRRDGGYPFVHVLDAQRGVAHCVGVPWTGNQDAIGRMKLVAGDKGLTIKSHGRTYATIDGAFRFKRATTEKASFPWWIALVVLAVATPGSLLGRSLRRRRSAATPA
jgi:hypothetical protein